jgi:hypothetical protein
MLCHVALVRTNVLEECIASIIMPNRISISLKRASVASYSNSPSASILVALAWRYCSVFFSNMYIYACEIVPHMLFL